MTPSSNFAIFQRVELFVNTLYYGTKRSIESLQQQKHLKIVIILFVVVVSIDIKWTWFSCVLIGVLSIPSKEIMTG